MSLVSVISLVGVVVGIELILRFVDYLYTRKGNCMGSHKKHTRTKTGIEKN